VFRIKICGITSVEDALAAVDAGADAIGLNFYPRSSRFVSLDTAAEISAAVGDQAKKIGVFVNADFPTIQQARDVAKLDGVQLHGDESPEFAAQSFGCPTIRARRFDQHGVAAIEGDLKACLAAGRLPDAVLVDAASPGQYGGTGETLSWPDLADHCNWLAGRPLILAGGLTPENIAEAIRTVCPHGVDVASGVESSPGVKDHEKIRAFVEAAKAAFADIRP